MIFIRLNQTRDMHCRGCGGYYVSTLDFEIHLGGEYHKNALANPVNRSKGSLTPDDLNKLPWRAFRSGKGWGINIELAPYLIDAINNGNSKIGTYVYYVCAEGRLIGRSLNKTGCF